MTHLAGKHEWLTSITFQPFRGAVEGKQHPHLGPQADVVTIKPRRSPLGLYFCDNHSMNSITQPTFSDKNIDKSHIVV